LQRPGEERAEVFCPRCVVRRWRYSLPLVGPWSVALPAGRRRSRLAAASKPRSRI